MKKTFLMVSCVLGIAAMVSSCGSKKKPMTDAEMAAKVDSLYQERITTLGPDMDNACDLRFETLVASKTDSILTANNVVQ
ncbi:MAG: hypothetical protein R2769_16935 [Saprospiraceae bacterium]